VRCPASSRFTGIGGADGRRRLLAADVGLRCPRSRKRRALRRVVEDGNFPRPKTPLVARVVRRRLRRRPRRLRASPPQRTVGRAEVTRHLHVARCRARRRPLFKRNALASPASHPSPATTSPRAIAARVFVFVAVYPALVARPSRATRAFSTSVSTSRATRQTWRRPLPRLLVFPSAASRPRDAVVHLHPHREILGSLDRRERPPVRSSRLVVVGRRDNRTFALVTVFTGFGRGAHAKATALHMQPGPALAAVKGKESWGESCAANSLSPTFRRGEGTRCVPLPSGQPKFILIQYAVSRA